MQGVPKITIPCTEFIEDGGYTLYAISVHLGVEVWAVRRRYSEFEKLQGQLVKSVALPPFPAKKWFGSNSPSVIEQRRLALAAYLAAAVTSSECCSDPALLAFLQMGAFRLKPADPIAATTGAVHAASEQPGAPSWGETKQVPPGQPVDSKYIPVEQVTSEMDVEDFVDFLLEKTALELIDVSEIPQPLEGDEVQRRTDFYCEELMDTSMPLPANTMRRWELNTAVSVSHGFGLPLPTSSATSPGLSVAALLQHPSTANDRDFIYAAASTAELIHAGVCGLGEPPLDATPLLVAMPDFELSEDATSEASWETRGNNEPSFKGKRLGRSSASIG